MTADRCELLCLDLEKAESLRASVLAVDEAEHLATLAKGLGDATRLALALALRDGGELCVCDLSWIVGRAENLVSHHLRLMRVAGITQSRRDGKMVLYSLTGRGRELLAALASQRVA